MSPRCPPATIVINSKFLESSFSSRWGWWRNLQGRLAWRLWNNTCLNFYISNWFTQSRPILVAGNLLLGGGWRSSQHIVVLKKTNGRYSDISQIDKLASVASAANLPNFNFNFQQIIKTRTALHPLDWIKVKSGYYNHLHLLIFIFITIMFIAKSASSLSSLTYQHQYY